MTAEEWLNRGYKLNETIKLLDKAKMRAYDIAVGTAIELKEKVQESHGNSVENKLVTYADYCRDIDKHKTKLFRILKEITGVIMQVEDSTLRNLLICRYINFETWNNIAEILHYGERQLYRLRRKALKKAGEFIPPPNTL